MHLNKYNRDMANDDRMEGKVVILRQCPTARYPFELRLLHRATKRGYKLPV